MPLYEYQCDECRHRFEVIQKFADPPIETCPKCGGPVHKLQSAPAFQFKGSGWYVTDYAKKDSGGTSETSGETKAGQSEPKGSSDKKESSTTSDKSDAAKSSSSSESSSSGSTTSTTPTKTGPS